jgi:major type 1 subunit fimbrin (pilin)
MKTKLISATIVAIAALGTQLAHAAPDGTITFTGAISATTCKINGGTAPVNFTVTMPTVSTTTLNAMDATAGRTGFRIALTGCTPATGNVHTYFEEAPPSIWALADWINAGSATAVEVELLNKDSSIITVGASDGVGVGLQNSKSVAITAGAANLDYYAQYHSTSAAGSGVGTVSSTVTYDISYN